MSSIIHELRILSWYLFFPFLKTVITVCSLLGSIVYLLHWTLILLQIAMIQNVSRFLFSPQGHDVWPHTLQFPTWKWWPQRVFQSVSVAVGENCHPKGRELALTGCVAQKNCARLIVSKKFLQVEIFAFVFWHDPWLLLNMKIQIKPEFTLSAPPIYLILNHTQATPPTSA